MQLNGSVAQELPADAYSGRQFLWRGPQPGNVPNPIYLPFPPPPLLTRQEMPWHPHSIFDYGLQVSTAFTFRSSAFGAPWKSFGIRVLTRPGASIVPGLKGQFVVPFDAIIQRMVLLADAPGSIVFDIYKAPLQRVLAGEPPGPTDSIIGGTAFRPTLNGAQNNLDFTLFDWNTTLSQNDVLAFAVLSCTGIASVTLALLVLNNETR